MSVIFGIKESREHIKEFFVWSQEQVMLGKKKD